MLAFRVGAGLVCRVASRGGGSDPTLPPGRRENIRQGADVVTNLGGEGEVMQLLLCFEEIDPPTGQLRRVPTPSQPPDGAVEPARFYGWLGLLRALSEMLEDADRPVPPTR